MPIGIMIAVTVVLVIVVVVISHFVTVSNLQEECRIQDWKCGSKGTER